MRGYVLVFSVWAGVVNAACPEGSDTVLSCTAGEINRLDVCQSGEWVRYSYGPIAGDPELELSEGIDFIDFYPWNGIGNAIYETLVFYNDDHAYEVFYTQDRFDEDKPGTGGVAVYGGGELLAQVDCDIGSVAFTLFHIGDEKAARGLCWDADTFIWEACAE